MPVQNGSSFSSIEVTGQEMVQGGFVLTQSVETIASAAKEVHKGFLALVEPHRSALWRYCCSLTASYWDGEDLFQETMTRAFATLTQTWQPISPRAYLFRIATNAWTDSLRKRNVEIDTYAVTENVPADEPRTDPDDVRHAMEVLVGVLPPRRTAVLLLMDVYGFTAPEVAGMVRCTVGAVYAALQRARSKLRTHGIGCQTLDSSPAAKRRAKRTCTCKLRFRGCGPKAHRSIGGRFADRELRCLVGADE